MSSGILENYSLLDRNTFGIDVSAKYFADIHSEEQLVDVCCLPISGNEQKFVLGGGSNILFTKDVEALVLHNQVKGIELIGGEGSNVIVEIGAGEIWHEVVKWAVSSGLGGIENLSLIPGYSGAAPIQNIGAYGVEIKDVFSGLTAVDLDSLEMKEFSADECQFAYRDSVFKREHRGRFMITRIRLKLTREPKINTSYGAIEKELKMMGVEEPGIAEVSEAVCNIRSSKLPDPKFIGNAGSFFKNPIVNAELLDSIREKHEEVVSYPAGAGQVKLAAGWLIEQCGWKGKVVGNTGAHKDQALVLVNYGSADGKEVYKLSQDILDSVEEEFGVRLEREVNVY